MKYAGIDDVDALNLAEKFEKRLGSNYNDLTQFLKGNFEKDIEGFSKEKYEKCQKQNQGLLKDQRNAMFLKNL